MVNNFLIEAPYDLVLFYVFFVKILFFHKIMELIYLKINLILKF